MEIFFLMYRKLVINLTGHPVHILWRCVAYLSYTLCNSGISCPAPTPRIEGVSLPAPFESALGTAEH